MGMSILFFTKHMFYSKKGVEPMKAHSNNDKTLDELGAFVMLVDCEQAPLGEFVRFGIRVKMLA